MLCKFCRHEFDDSLTECPYCHRIVEVEPQSLTREERDSFSGTTIEADGSVRDDRNRSDSYIYEERDAYDPQEGYGRQEDARSDRAGSGIHVYRFGGLMTWLITILVILGLVFFLLPAFLVVAVAGAFISAIVLFVMRLFQ